MKESTNGAAPIERFIAFWREMPLDGPPYLHPADVPFVQPEPSGPSQLQLNVVPIPVNGCLRTADIIILMANPNFDAAQEADWAARDPDGGRRLEQVRRRNLRQEHQPSDCPFYDLDPRLSQSPGASYWRRGNKFRDAVDVLRSVWNVPLDDVFRQLSWRVAVLQMLPYRSKEFRHEKLAAVCPSSRHARELAHALAEDSDKLVICQRRVRQWQFSFPSVQSNLITYKPQGEAIGASLSLASRGGPRMIEMLKSRSVHAAV